MDEYHYDEKKLKRVTIHHRITRLEKARLLADLIFIFQYVLIVGLIVSQVVIYAKYIK